jgi:hypothetical protein
MRRQLDDLYNELVDFKPLRLRAGFLQGRTNPGDDVAGPLPIGDDIPHRPPHLPQAWGLACEPAQTGIAIVDDGGERLVHLMGNRGRQLSQGHHARDVCQFRLGRVQRLFG